MVEDKLLIWRFKRGSTDALRRIYEKYKDALLKIAFVLVHEASAAEDVVHDVFVSFAESVEKVSLRGNLKSYLATCVVNRIRNINRAKRRRGTVGLNEVGPIVSDSENPGSWIIHSEELTQLNNAIAQLPYRQREVIILHLQGGMKFRAIAKLQDVSINTVQSRYRYGLDKLRTLLNSKERR